MGGHRLVMEEIGTTFTVDRLRRDRQELIGELTVSTTLPGARTVNGILSTGDFNFSSVRARQDRAKLLATRAKTGEKIDWYAGLEEFCQGVFMAEREGSPSQDLREIPRPNKDELFLDGVYVPRRHPTIVFGDGGSGKSYLALYWAGYMVQRLNLKVGLFDWELSGEDHRERLEMLFADKMPLIHYCRCEAPLIHEVDRLSRIVKEKALDYAIFDSVAFACDGPPESAEIAGKYFRALRGLNIGGLHIAHVNKSETADRRPFGSAFWHNGARSTWYIEAEDRDGDEMTHRIALYNRKSNLGRLSRPVSYLLKFETNYTTIDRVNITDSSQFSDRLSIRERMRHILKHGAMSPEAISEEIDAEVESVKKAIRRGRKDFVVLDGGKVGLVGYA